MAELHRLESYADADHHDCLFSQGSGRNRAGWNCKLHRVSVAQQAWNIAALYNTMLMASANQKNQLFITVRIWSWQEWYVTTTTRACTHGSLSPLIWWSAWVWLETTAFTVVAESSWLFDLAFKCSHYLSGGVADTKGYDSANAKTWQGLLLTAQRVM